MDTSRLAYLLQRYFDKTHSSAEYDELMTCIAQLEGNEQLSAELQSLYNKYMEAGLKEKDHQGKPLYRVEEADQMISRILARHPAPAMKYRKRMPTFSSWQKVAAVLIVALFGLVFWQQKYARPVRQAASAEAVRIKPGGNFATLTLADGTTVDLKDVKNGEIVSTNGIKIVKTADGQLQYEITADAKTAAPNAQHTISTPRGGQYQIKLPDGTQVWLNASSSLQYPVRFTGKQRRVALEGEGYFEVAKNPLKPFVVVSRGQNVTVLGTHFNVNAYADEESVKTTLLEGSVKVSRPQADQAGLVLKPGQQSLVSGGEASETLVREVKVQDVIAWKHGKFQFQNAHISEVLRQFSRWYNVDFQYAGKLPNIYLSGDINRSVDAQEALDIMKFFDLEYKIKNELNKKVIIIH
jgi:ferric-dicitrate binding protein FerR (iron transport regulator)